MGLVGVLCSSSATTTPTTTTTTTIIITTTTTNYHHYHHLCRHVESSRRVADVEHMLCFRLGQAECAKRLNPPHPAGVLNPYRSLKSHPCRVDSSTPPFFPPTGSAHCAQPGAKMFFFCLFLVSVGQTCLATALYTISDASGLVLDLIFLPFWIHFW